MKTRNDDPNQPAHDDQDKKPDPRRNLLKSLAVGGVAGAALPGQWSRPVIDSVILPAHAQTTTGRVTGGGGGGGTAPGGPAPSQSAGEALMDFFVNPARADPVVEDYCLELDVTVAGGVITGVTVTKMCFNACKPNTRWFDREIAPTALTGSGDNWMGNVDGIQLLLANVNPNGAKLADSQYGGVGGEIFANQGCDCSCTD